MTHPVALWNGNAKSVKTPDFIGKNARKICLKKLKKTLKIG
jgi:hypothetical protein